MLSALLTYCCATGTVCLPRRIEEATYSDVAARFIVGDTHLDHDTICTFRRVNGQAFRELFVKVLAVAGQRNPLKQVGGIGVDRANCEVRQTPRSISMTASHSCFHKAARSVAKSSRNSEAGSTPETMSRSRARVQAT